jgi:hypothetical protein
VVLLDVSLDHAGVPDGVDPAWQAKHYLGTPCPGGDEASVNLAHVVAAVEFVAVEMADLPSEKDTPTPDEGVADHQWDAAHIDCRNASNAARQAGGQYERLARRWWANAYPHTSGHPCG